MGLTLPVLLGHAGAEVGTAGSTLFLCGLHLAHLGATLWLHLPAYHLLLHSVLATVWLVVALLTIRASKVGGAIRQDVSPM
jgi:hypothetical protein